jgi:hypothetical protein
MILKLSYKVYIIMLLSILNGYYKLGFKKDNALQIIIAKIVRYPTKSN